MARGLEAVALEDTPPGDVTGTNEYKAHTAEDQRGPCRELGSQQNFYLLLQNFLYFPTSDDTLIAFTVKGNKCTSKCNTKYTFRRLWVELHEIQHG